MEPAAPPARPRLPDGAWMAAAAVAFWSFGFTALRGSDLWWHLAAGRWLLQAWRWPLRDPWSFTRHGQPWLNHEWLSDVVFHLWSRVLGLPSLVFWKWGLLVGTFLLLVHTLRRVSRSLAAGVLASLLGAAVGSPFFDVRPHLYSLLGFALVLHLALGRRPSPWLPAVFLPWVNLHGGFFYGLLALSVLCAVSWWSEGTPFPWPVWTGSVAACLLNPHGVLAFAYPLRYAFDRTSPFLSIGEWRSPLLAGGIAAPLFLPVAGVWIAALVLVYASGRFREERTLTLSATALGLLTLAMALRSRRFIPLFGMAQALMLAPAIALVAALAGRRLSLGVATRRGIEAVALLTVLGLGVFRLARQPLAPGPAFRALTMEDTFPRAMTDYVAANGIAGKAFAYYNWGGYLHLRTEGRLQVYIDGRADTVFDADTYRRYVDVLLEREGWLAIVDSSGADYVLWPKDEAEQVEELVRTGHWRLLHEDELASLLVRAPQAP